MKLWAAFFDHLLPDVPGCQPPMAAIALRHAAQAFCERTRAWDVWLDPTTTVDGISGYDFEISNTQEVVKLLGATLNGQDLRVLSVNDLPDGWMDKDTGVRGIVTQDRRLFYVLPTPAADLTVKTRVALKPSNTGTGVSDELFAHYLDVICVGARARLHASMKKPYSSPALAESCKADFESLSAQIARKVEKSFSRTPRRTLPHFF